MIDDIVSSMCEDLLNTGTVSPLGNVILYDQVPRHVFRNQDAAHIITYFLHRSLMYLEIIETDKLTDLEWCFAMLPYRHKGINVLEVINKAWERYKKSGDEHIRRFIKACYNRIPPNFNISHYPHFVFNSISEEDVGFDCSRYRTLFDFCPSTKCFKSYLDVFKYNKMLTDISSSPVLQQNEVVLSLSGGVDSMVCLHILHHMLPKHVKLQAVHVNYHNRGCQNIGEEKFLIHWCDYYNIDLTIVSTIEISRSECMKYNMRDLYEKYTRSRRFAGYRRVGDHVVLGHNKDDTLENIFTNIASASHYDNLKGMKPVTYEDGVLFYRPLLNVSKDEIISFAQHHNIPYFKNSTPTWSQRGMIRNEIVPVVDKWNPKFKKGLFKITEEVTEMYNFIQAFAKTARVNYIPKTSCKVFWKSFFETRKVSISQKSLGHFIQKILSLEAGSSTYIMINKDTKLLIFSVDEFHISIQM